MPNIKSAIRKVKRAKKPSIVNKLRKSKYKQALKKMHKFIEKKDTQGAKKYFPDFQSELMKVAKTGVIKKKNISRKISKISKKIKNLTK